MLMLGTIKISPGKGRCERKGGRTLACLRDYVSEQGGGNGGPRNQRVGGCGHRENFGGRMVA